MNEVVPWEEFYRTFDWRQGEHVSLIGPTHCGKTTLALSILEKRQFVVAFGTKPKDSTLDKLVKSGWKRITTWNQRPELIAGAGRPPPTRIVLWPKFVEAKDQLKHRPEFEHALADMFAEGNWACFADEVGYISKDLGLDWLLKRWWQQGRSIKLSMVSATQRPVWVPPEMYTQAAHLFLWASNDKRDLKRLADIGGPSGMELAQKVANLNFHKHEVLYVNVRTGRSVITIPPK